MEILNLDQIVIKSLDFFIHNQPAKLNINQFKFPFVIGSGNAYNTGSILFSGRNAILADESNFRSIAKAYSPMIKDKTIKEAIIISASGEKDSVWEIELAKKLGLNTTLLTCEKNSSAAQIADQVFTYRKIAEPYTYNTSTYLGMILGITNENPTEIKKIIKRIKIPKNFSDHDCYTFILPDEFINICPMLDIKKNELFGPYLNIRAFTQGHARHAKFVIPSEKELVITLGEKNKIFGLADHRYNLKLPSSAKHGFILALTYYLIGKIQETKPSYFKEHITSYCLERGPIAYGSKKVFDVIVPGN